MDFDSIMVVLVVIYFIWRSISEAKQKMKNRRHMDTEEQHSDNEFLEKLFDVNEPVAFTLDDGTTTPPQPKSQKTEVNYLTKGLKKKKKKPRQQSEKAAAVQEPDVVPPSSFRRRRINRKRLREAIIWSELLGRPLALRDEQGPQGL